MVIRNTVLSESPDANVYDEFIEFYCATYIAPPCRNLYNCNMMSLFQKSEYNIYIYIYIFLIKTD